MLDGDGALIMNMGVLSTIGDKKPKNLTHIVFDNAVYGSTGGQRTTSPTTNFAGVARNCGYASAATVKSVAGLNRKLAAIKGEPGPHMIVVNVGPGHRKEIGRLSRGPADITKQVRSV